MHLMDGVHILHTYIYMWFACMCVCACVCVHMYYLRDVKCETKKKLLTLKENNNKKKKSLVKPTFKTLPFCGKIN